MSSVSVFWNLFSACADFNLRFIAPFEKWRFIEVPDGVHEYHLPVIPDDFLVWSVGEKNKSPYPVAPLGTERVELNKIAWQWHDHIGPFRMYSVYIGYGSKTKTVCYGDFKQYEKDFIGFWDEA